MILARAIEIQKGHWEQFSEIIKLQFEKKKKKKMHCYEFYST